MAHQAFSDVLGYSSIACWLGAQFPQVVENIKSQSCEGLALPFLANWLMGDISNLVGCLLTHQLPFQTFLASYFVVVDCTLVGQYLYYMWKSPPHIASHHRVYSTGRRMSIDSPVSRYRTLSVVAGNVAKAAALAAAHDEHAGPPRSRSGRSTRTHTSHDRFHNSTSCLSLYREPDDELDDNVLTALSDSSHSDTGGRRAHVSWSVERHGRGGSTGHTTTRTGLPSPYLPHVESPVATGPQDSLIRGRSLQREAEILDEAPVSDRGHSRSAKRGSGIIFFGVWALLSFNAFTGTSPPPSFRAATFNGRVLSARGLPIQPAPSAIFVSDAFSTRQVVDVYGLASSDSPGYEATSEPNNERILGRIFAWLCTTLYLTSRLPQIWKNYVRKSVQGLSVYLFIFAFLGNTFYVASILSSPTAYLPPPASTDFIKESIPYLIGSGGTLMFDVTIVIQTILYRPKRLWSEEETRLLDNGPVNSVESLHTARTLSRG